MKTLFGNPMNEDRVFLVKPGYLGTITNAFSSLTTSSSNLTKEKRIFIRLLATLGGGAFGFACSYFTHVETGTNIIVTSVCALLALGIAVRFTPSKYHHLFVGTEGLAEYVIDAATQEHKVLQRMRYEDAGYLLQNTTHHYRNHIYQHTTFKYEWFNHEGDRIFYMEGIYNKNTAPHKVEAKTVYYMEPRYYFLVLGELGWTDFLIRKTEQQEKGNAKLALEFPLFSDDGSNRGNLTLSRGTIVAEVGKKTKTFTNHELEKLYFSEGVLYINDDDSFWTMFGSKDGVRVATSSISNSLFFIHMARKWLNIKG